MKHGEEDDAPVAVHVRLLAYPAPQHSSTVAAKAANWSCIITIPKQTWQC
jgi:hypothetical protein